MQILSYLFQSVPPSHQSVCSRVEQEVSGSSQLWAAGESEELFSSPTPTILSIKSLPLPDKQTKMLYKSQKEQPRNRDFTCIAGYFYHFPKWTDIFLLLACQNLKKMLCSEIETAASRALKGSLNIIFFVFKDYLAFILAYSSVRGQSFI